MSPFSSLAAPLIFTVHLLATISYNLTYRQSIFAIFKPDSLAWVEIMNFLASNLYTMWYDESTIPKMSRDQQIVRVRLLVQEVWKRNNLRTWFPFFILTTRDKRHLKRLYPGIPGWTSKRPHRRSHKINLVDPLEFFISPSVCHVMQD